MKRILFWLGLFVLVTFIFGGWFWLTAWAYTTKGLLWAVLVFSAFAAAITELLNNHLQEPAEDDSESGAVEGALPR